MKFTRSLPRLAALALTTALVAAAPAQADTVSLDLQSAWPLTMPASGQNAEYLAEKLNALSGGSLKVKVGDRVRRGSSRVVLPEEDLARRSRVRRFSWDWARERTVLKDGRAYLVTEDHRAAVVVAVVSH